MLTATTPGRAVFAVIALLFGATALATTDATSEPFTPTTLRFRVDTWLQFPCADCENTGIDITDRCPGLCWSGDLHDATDPAEPVIGTATICWCCMEGTGCHGGPRYSGCFPTFDFKWFVYHLFFEIPGSGSIGATMWGNLKEIQGPETVLQGNWVPHPDYTHFTMGLPAVGGCSAETTNCPARCAHPNTSFELVDNLTAATGVFEGATGTIRSHGFADLRDQGGGGFCFAQHDALFEVDIDVPAVAVGGSGEEAVPPIGLSAAPLPYTGGPLQVRLERAPSRGGPGASLMLYAADGRLVRVIAQHAADRRSLTWDGTDDRGEPVGSGVYYLRASSGPHTETIEVNVVR